MYKLVDRLQLTHQYEANSAEFGLDSCNVKQLSGSHGFVLKW